MKIKPGNVCKCQSARLGIVTQTTRIEGSHGYTDLYKGIGFDGTPWQSKKPTKIAESVQDWLAIHTSVMMENLAELQDSVVAIRWEAEHYVE